MNTAMLNPGVERQVGTSLEDIRDDHKERYLWAAERLAGTETVLDAGCGVGYGSTLLAQRAGRVYAVDISEDAIAYAKRYWAMPNISHAVQDLCFFSVANAHQYDAIVAFEVIEHLIEPRLFLLRAFDALLDGGRIFVSVPNERVIPHTVNLNPFHLKHYTTNEVRDLLRECGFEVKAIASQNTKEITEGDSGRFMVLEATRQRRLPDSVDPVGLPQQALNRAANFIVARAVAIHKATKDIRSLKTKLEEASKAAASSEPRSESQLRLLQFVETFQSQTQASKDLLVADLMRRVKEVESFERELRERVMQAEVQRIKAEEALRYTQEKSRDQSESMGKLSAELAQAAKEKQALAIEFEQVRRQKDAEISDISRARQELLAERAALRSQCDEVLAERDALAARIQTELSATAAQLEQAQGDAQGLRIELSQTAQEKQAIAAELERVRHHSNSEVATSIAQLEQARNDIAAQLEIAKKQASQAQAKRNAMSVRLLAVGNDNLLIMEANQELSQKLQTAETEASRLQRSIRTLQVELQSQTAVVSKGPPSWGKIYKKLRFHRFYVPFLYKATRNSVRNQLKRFRAKA